MTYHLPFIAAELAEYGWHVFPCRPGGKEPATTHGVKDASNDLEQVADWWARTPAANIGIACGPSRLVVIDLDMGDNKNGIKRWTELAGDYPPAPTYTVTTPSGGRHHYYQADQGPELHNSASKLAPGIDVRAAGGYVLAAWSMLPNGHYSEPAHPLEVAPIPGWLATTLRPAPRKPPERSGNVYGTHGTPYGARAVSDEMRILRATPEGRRNQQLNISAFNLYQLVETGDLDPVAVYTQLVETGYALGLDGKEIENTIQSAEAGAKQKLRPPR